MPDRRPARRAAALAGAAAIGLLAACGTQDSGVDGSPATSPATSDATSDAPPPSPAVAAADRRYTGDGLSVAAAGLRYHWLIPPAVPLGEPVQLYFRIVDPAGGTFNRYLTDHARKMHFYLIRSDLSGFQHLKPTTGGTGIWTALLAPVQPGTYRTYAAFVGRDPSGAPLPLVLSDRLTVPGPASTPVPLPAPSNTAVVDGYTVTVGGDQLVAGAARKLTVEITKDGRPPLDLQPYLDVYAHLTAFHQGDLAFAQPYSTGMVVVDGKRPVLTYDVTLPAPGNWRLFVQFQSGEQVHTGAVTVTAR